MAVRTYYGTCATASSEEVKEVYIPDVDLAEQDFNFNEGDLLVVFFVDTNIFTNPSIAVYLQDTEHEISTNVDNGKQIKSLDIVADMENAWAAGETVVFAYTQQSVNGTYYWEMIDANHASMDTYGDTKLFDDTDLSTWIVNPIEDQDSTIALTPNTLKKFFNLLTTGDTSPIGLIWEQHGEGTSNVLGNLSLSNSDSGIQITYPIQDAITTFLSNNGQDWPITHTGQLINNGNGNESNTVIKVSEPNNISDEEIRVFIDEHEFQDEFSEVENYNFIYHYDDQQQLRWYYINGENEIPIILEDYGIYCFLPENTTEASFTVTNSLIQRKTGNAEPFITRVVPNDLYFDNGKGLIYGAPTDENPRPARIILNDSNNKLVLGNSADNTFTAITLGKPTTIHGNTTITGGNLAVSGNTTSSNITATTNVVATNGIIKEKNVPLSERYSPILQTFVTTTPTLTINAGKASPHRTGISITKTGYTPIGVVGYDISYAGTDDWDALYANLFECRLVGNEVRYQVFNTRNKQIKITITFYVLYTKILS